MAAEPAGKRTYAFGYRQSLFHNARSAIGYTYPNHDGQIFVPVVGELLAVRAVAQRRGMAFLHEQS